MARPNETSDERYRREKEAEMYAENGPRNTEITYQELTDNPYVRTSRPKRQRRAANDNRSPEQDLDAAATQQTFRRGRRRGRKTLRKKVGGVQRAARVLNRTIKGTALSVILFALYIVQVLFAIAGLVGMMLIVLGEKSTIADAVISFIGLFSTVEPADLMFASIAVTTALGVLYLLIFAVVFPRQTLRMFTDSSLGWIIAPLLLAFCFFPVTALLPWSGLYLIALVLGPTWWHK